MQQVEQTGASIMNDKNITAGAGRVNKDVNKLQPLPASDKNQNDSVQFQSVHEMYS